ncbi:MAG TPA: septation protein A [Burkholderiaceae bacterium]|jgi:intracellular septation protein|nr:septation protein A [Burkholderiaceae bacterium]
MKLLFDFLPLVFFFATYKVAGLHADAAATLATHWLGGWVSGGSVGPKEAPVLLATLVVIAATIVQVLWMKLQRRRIDLMLWISLALIVVLGGLTIWLHDETFIKWKSTVAFWTMGLVFWASQALFRRNLLREMLGSELELPDAVWQRLNFAWVAYFAVMGLINLWFVYAFSTDAWATFHSFGTMGCTVLFVVGQGFYLSRHLDQTASKAQPESRP